MQTNQRVTTKITVPLQLLRMTVNKADKQISNCSEAKPLVIKNDLIVSFTNILKGSFSKIYYYCVNLRFRNILGDITFLLLSNTTMLSDILFTSLSKSHNILG